MQTFKARRQSKHASRAEGKVGSEPKEERLRLFEVHPAQAEHGEKRERSRTQRLRQSQISIDRRHAATGFVRH